VLAYFSAEYEAGLTPNPCLQCNRTIKFGALLDRALRQGYDGVATGHYARLKRRPHGVELYRAVDAGKDQSYVLSVLTQAQLSRAWFPLGVSTKPEVRAQATSLGLPVANTAESMDLCFIPDGDTAGWLSARLGARPGEIVDESGAVLGRHGGTYRYTVGQRKGLDIRVPAADGSPRFVLGVDAPAARLVVGPRRRLEVTELRCRDAVWTSGTTPAGPIDVRVQVRAHGDEHEAAAMPAPGNDVTVTLPQPITGVAPGQTAAFYDRDQVVGSARIVSAVPIQ
jgi:tRNA-specific 2-thiouridylase